MSSNKSIAVWCTPTAGSTGIGIEVHFNYWRIAPRKIRRHWLWRWLWSIWTWLRGQKHIADFIEIGIMFDDVRLVDRLHFFLPMPIKRAAVHDCAPCFENGQVLQGIFNEQLTATPPITGPGPLIVRKGRRTAFRMLRFTKARGQIAASDVDLQPFARGTLCSITSPALARCLARSGASKAYVRLRFDIPEGEANPFVEDVPVYDHMLLSGYDQIEYLDFRLNELRTLPKKVEDRMLADQPAAAVKMKMVAFLTAIPVSADLSATNTEFHKMRLLEHDIWSDYAANIPRGMVVYHWKREPEPHKPIRDFTAFVKLQARVSNRSILFTYLGFALAFGILGNLAAEWVKDAFVWFVAGFGKLLHLAGMLLAQTIYPGAPYG